jgi:hypothetical protein
MLLFVVSLVLVFVFTLFNVLPIESISYNRSLVFISNLTGNLTLHDHCLMNMDTIDFRASIHSTGVLVNVFLYTCVGLVLPTVIILVLSIVLRRKSTLIWNELYRHQQETGDVSLRHDSPVVEYLRTYNAAFILAIVFVCLSMPSKLLRLLVLLISDDLDGLPSRQILFHAHAHMQTIGHAFELAIYSYKCLVCLAIHRRFQCALRYLFTFDRRTRPSTRRFSARTPFDLSPSDDVRPLDVFYRHLQIDRFESPVPIDRRHDASDMFSQQSVSRHDRAC